MNKESTSTLVEPEGYTCSVCSYCDPQDKCDTESSYYVGITASRLTCADYQKMLDRGWSRAGTYLYKPDMRRTCCPQYTIRLDALVYVPTKKHRKVISRWTRYVANGENGAAVRVRLPNDGDAVMSASDEIQGAAPVSSTSASKHDSTRTVTGQFDLVDAIHASESTFSGYDKVNDTGQRPRHTFETTLEPASYSDEKFALYRSYQANVHQDTRNHSPERFKLFLVQSPLEPVPIRYDSEPPAHLPRTFGSYHQLYRLDGRLIALAVLDILPMCVLSVYFIYDSAWERFSLGKLSILREVSLAREIHRAGARTVQYLYLGYYVHSCQKTRYKGDYSPSELLDPEVYSWHNLNSVCVPLLGRPGARYVSFAHPEHVLGVADIPSEPTPEEISEEDAREIMLLNGRTELVSFLDAKYRGRDYMREMILFAINGLGLELAKAVVFNIGW